MKEEEDKRAAVEEEEEEERLTYAVEEKESSKVRFFDQIQIKTNPALTILDLAASVLPAPVLSMLVPLFPLTLLSIRRWSQATPYKMGATRLMKERTSDPLP